MLNWFNFIFLMSWTTTRINSNFLFQTLWYSPHFIFLEKKIGFIFGFLIKSHFICWIWQEDTLQLDISDLQCWQANFRTNHFKTNHFKTNHFKINNFKNIPFKMYHFKTHHFKTNHFKNIHFKMYHFKTNHFKTNHFKNILFFKMHHF